MLFPNKESGWAVIVAFIPLLLNYVESQAIKPQLSFRNTNEDYFLLTKGSTSSNPSLQYFLNNSSIKADVVCVIGFWVFYGLPNFFNSPTNGGAIIGSAASTKADYNEGCVALTPEFINSLIRAESYRPLGPTEDLAQPSITVFNGTGFQGPKRTYRAAVEYAASSFPFTVNSYFLTAPPPAGAVPVPVPAFKIFWEENRPVTGFKTCLVMSNPTGSIPLTMYARSKLGKLGPEPEDMVLGSMHYYSTSDTIEFNKNCPSPSTNPVYLDRYYLPPV